MTRDKYSAGSEIKASVALVFPRVSKKYATSRTWLQFVWRCGKEIWEAQAAERAEMGICRMLPEKKKMRGGMTDDSRGANVE
jgi:hypothetical protein